MPESPAPQEPHDQDHACERPPRDVQHRIRWEPHGNPASPDGDAHRPEGAPSLIEQALHVVGARGSRCCGLHPPPSVRLFDNAATPLRIAQRCTSVGCGTPGVRCRSLNPRAGWPLGSRRGAGRLTRAFEERSGLVRRGWPSSGDGYELVSAGINPCFGGRGSCPGPSRDAGFAGAVRRGSDDSARPASLLAEAWRALCRRRPRQPTGARCCGSDGRCCPGRTST